MKNFLLTTICIFTLGEANIKAQTSPIAEYTFDNSYGDITGFTPFSSINTSFVNDRNGNANGAMNRSSFSTNNWASILYLPTGASARTVSLWVRSTDVGNASAQRGIFSYGSGGTANVFGAYFANSGSRITFQGDNDQIIINSPIILNNWFHLVISYDGTNVKGYINGLLRHTFPKTLNTTNSVFSLGNFVGDVDDLKIYDYALSDNEVSNLFGLVPQMIAQYTFDNTYYDINGNAPFSNYGTSFVTDRHGNFAGALNRTATSILNSATISSIPKADQARTISIWVKSTQNNANAQIFSYGTSGPNYFGVGFYNNDTTLSFNFGDPVISNFAVIPNTWFHFVITYDGITAKVYVNGILKNTFNKALNTLSSSGNFGLGTFVGDVDDLKIFNYAVSDSVVTDLYLEAPITTDVSSFEKINNEFIIYPNPASDNITINFESLTIAYSTIEVINTVGQIILKEETKNELSKNLSLSNLSNGIYFVQLKQNGKPIYTKKLVINNKQ